MAGDFYPQVIFFDAVGTLIEIRGGVGEIYHRVAKMFDIEVEPSVLQDNFALRFREQPAMAFPSGVSEAELVALEKDWWRNLVKDVFAGLGPFPRIDEFFDEIFEGFRGREFWLVYDDVGPALTELKLKGIKLGVISNFDSRLFDLLPDCGLDRYFDSVHISTRAGAAKPDPAIFQAALNYHHIEARQAWHIGDGYREDVEGAMTIGINAILIDRENRFDDNSRATRITSLEQVVSLLEP